MNKVRLKLVLLLAVLPCLGVTCGAYDLYSLSELLPSSVGVGKDNVRDVTLKRADFSEDSGFTFDPYGIFLPPKTLKTLNVEKDGFVVQPYWAIAPRVNRDALVAVFVLRSSAPNVFQIDVKSIKLTTKKTGVSYGTQKTRGGITAKDSDSTEPFEVRYGKKWNGPLPFSETGSKPLTQDILDILPEDNSALTLFFRHKPGKDGSLEFSVRNLATNELLTYNFRLSYLGRHYGD